ncbi:hypothetical protein DERF_001794 [Dermatophagoides farinae]|uniref:Uncharacterized protein n=1 Tax=Dermatophagoides farinae TaxID=6954 RepID=A0A922HUQ0_DERFA|nr:hypothetical protein DERF_009776 [Dermatophagoides farinae]KAH9527798.1 hypothetical protein DERF_001794 [Dermatophagoides farinae]
MVDHLQPLNSTRIKVSALATFDSLVTWQRYSPSSDPRSIRSIINVPFGNTFYTIQSILLDIQRLDNVILTKLFTTLSALT